MNPKTVQASKIFGRQTTRKNEEQISTSNIKQAASATDLILCAQNHLAGKDEVLHREISKPEASKMKVVSTDETRAVPGESDVDKKGKISNLSEENIHSERISVIQFAEKRQCITSESYDLTDSVDLARAKNKQTLDSENSPCSKRSIQKTLSISEKDISTEKKKNSKLSEENLQSGRISVIQFVEKGVLSKSYDFMDSLDLARAKNKQTLDSENSPGSKRSIQKTLSISEKDISTEKKKISKLSEENIHSERISVIQFAEKRQGITSESYDLTDSVDLARAKNKQTLDSENSPASRKSRQKTLGISEKDILTDNKQVANFHKSINFKATNEILFDQSHLVGENILYREISELEASMESVVSIEDTLAVPGPSVVNEKLNSSKEIEQNLQSSNLSDSQRVDKGKTLKCKCCKDDILTSHKKKGDKFRCCKNGCTYTTTGHVNLLIHSYIHRDLKTCKICGKEYEDMKNDTKQHEKQQTCIICGENFQCKTKLKEHYVAMSSSNSDKHEESCWGCNNFIKNHIRSEENKINYLCCLCSARFIHRSRLEKHMIKDHPPKLFCTVCKEDYKVAEIGSHDTEHKCKFCNKKFECETLLWNHYLDEINCSDRHCSKCERKASNHVIDNDPKNTYFKCCQCSFKTLALANIKKHLLNHYGLKLFKCIACGTRYDSYQGLRDHIYSCRYVN